MSGGCRAGRHLECQGDDEDRCSCDCHYGEIDWPAPDTQPADSGEGDRG